MKNTQVSNAAVVKATGKDWAHWFGLIDSHDGKNKDHKGIVAVLSQHTNLDGWWQQMVTVEYEIARGLRKVHETPDGFQIGKSKTLTAPVNAVYPLWAEKDKRGKWLDDPGFTIRKATENKSMRITWVDGKSHLDVYFYPKGEKTQVTINHKKLSDSESAEKMKSYWDKQLKQLAGVLAN